MSSNITLDMTIADVQTQWPKTAVVFKQHAVSCLGCELASFCTLTEAAAHFKLPLPTFMALLQDEISQSARGKQ